MQFLRYFVDKSIKKPFLAKLFVAIGLFYPMIGSAILIQDLPTYRIVDNDILKRGNLTLIREQGIDYQYQSVSSNGQSYYVGKFAKDNFEKNNKEQTSISSEKSDNLQFLVLHDSEDAGFDSGLQWIADNGGQIWVLENQERRNLFNFATQKTTNSDPNRIFWGLDTATTVNVKLPTKPNEENWVTKTNPHAEFAHYLLEQIGVVPTVNQSNKQSIPDKQSTPNKPSILVALHNNSPDGQFGMDTIAKFGNTRVACQHDNEPKNLYWIATNTQADSAVSLNSHALVQTLCQDGQFNVVQETAPSVADGDGSLSVYMANHAPNWQYVNIEIKAGEKGNPVDEQRAKQQQLHYINNLLK